MEGLPHPNPTLGRILVIGRSVVTGHNIAPCKTLPSTMITTLSILLLLIINAFFVAAEFALVKVPGIRIEALANDGNFLAGLTLTIKSNLEAYLAACQLGITMASLGLGWIGEPAVAALLKPLFIEWGFSAETLHIASFLTGFILFSALHIVIGEQVPKTWAIRTSDKVAMWVSIPLIGFYWMAFPLNWSLNKASTIVLRAIGVKEVSHVEILTGIEISGLIDVSKDHGAIGSGQAEMLQNLFRFDERVVHSIMRPRNQIKYIDYQSNPAEILAILTQTHYSRLPVIDGSWNNLKGVVIVKDMLVGFLAGDAPSIDAYIRPPQLVPESQAIRLLFEHMRTNRDHLAFAIDEYGQVDGLVTLEDVLEEVVGDINDESDDEEMPFYLHATALGWVAHGLVPMHDLERQTGFDAAEPVSASTVSGFLTQRLQKIPAAGDQWLENGYQFTVSRIKDARIDEVEINVPNSASTAPVDSAAD